MLAKKNYVPQKKIEHPFEEFFFGLFQTPPKKHMRFPQQNKKTNINLHSQTRTDTHRHQQTLTDSHRH